MINVRDYGAVGDGYADDTGAIVAAYSTAYQRRNCVYFPTGEYLLTNRIHFDQLACGLTVVGDGPNASIVLFRNCDGMNFHFAQNAAQQPWGLHMRDIGLHALGGCGTALTVSYGAPSVSNDHAHGANSISNVNIVSSPEGSWANGVELEGVWNPRLHNMVISGCDHGGNWNALSGSAINLRRMCVNAHISNVQCNFWAEGLRAHSEGGQNTEGIFCSNNSMVAVQRGVWLRGDTSNQQAPRISTFAWTGGMIEIRATGVTTGSAGMHLENCWDTMVNGCQLLCDTKTAPSTTYGAILQGCRDATFVGNSINAFNRGIFGNCGTYNVYSAGNMFPNTDNPFEIA